MQQLTVSALCVNQTGASGIGAVVATFPLARHGMACPATMFGFQLLKY
jgi:hypothetical protein